MDSSDTFAEKLLDDYDWLITSAAHVAASKLFGSKYNGNLFMVYDSLDMADVLQVTREVMLGYAGIRVEKHPHHFGKLHTLREKCEDTPEGKRHFLGVLHKMLWQDVCQNMGRDYDKTFESKVCIESIYNYEETNGEGRENDSLRIDVADPNVNVERDAIESTRGAPERKLSARYPLLWMREVEGFTNEIIAEKSGVSLATIKRRIRLEKIQGAKDPGNTPTSLARGEDVSTDAPFELGDLQRCDLQRNGLGPKRGHCKWCTRAIRDAAVTEAGRFAHKYRDGGNCYCLIKYYVGMAMDYQEHGPCPSEFTSYIDYGKDAAVDIYETLWDIHTANKKAPLRKEWS
jgi:hypothetical protein